MLSFKKNFNFFKFIKILNQLFKSKISVLSNSQVFHNFKIKRIFNALRKKILKKNYVNNKFLKINKRIAKKKLVYIDSLKRYTRVQILNNTLVKDLLKQEYDNLKDYKIHRMPYYIVRKLFNLKKKSKNYKMRIRNKYLGRVNYRKYKLHQRKEMLQEVIKKQKLIDFMKKNKRLYVYFRIQRNSSKGVLNQPKMMFKSLYNAGSYFKQTRYKLNLFTKGSNFSSAILHNYSKFNMFMFKTKIRYNFNFLTKDEFQTFFSYLDGFKKNRLSASFWRISKNFYFSKFYLKNIKTFYYEKFLRKKGTQEIKRLVSVHVPLNGKLYSTFDQYNYRYLKHLERTIAVTNKIYRKYKNSWTKDFFSYKEHLKIFNLIQQKLYYGAKLSQKAQLKTFKIKFTDALKTKKYEIVNIKVYNKYKKLSSGNRQLIISKYYNQLQTNLKNFVFINYKSKKLKHFLDFFLNYNFNHSNRCGFLKDFFSKDIVKYKMNNSSIFFSSVTSHNNIDYAAILKNQVLTKSYSFWLKLFLWNFNSLKKNNFSNYILCSSNFQHLDTVTNLVHKVRKDKKKDLLFFGKFLRYFNEKIDLNTYFEIYNKNFLLNQESMLSLVQFFQKFFFFF